MTPELEARLRCLAELAVASERRAHITELAQDPAIERGKVLRATAAILTTNVRRDDAVARDGGEEFLRVFPATDRDIARSVCEGIVTAFRTTRHELGPQPESVAVSIDSATHGGGQRSPNAKALIQAADWALYRKTAGTQPHRPLRGRRARAGGAVPASESPHGDNHAGGARHNESRARSCARAHGFRPPLTALSTRAVVAHGARQ